MFDVVFLDPPFADDPWESLLAALRERLAPGARIYAEAASELIAPAGFERLRHGRAGNVHYHLFTLADPEGAAPR